MKIVRFTIATLLLFAMLLPFTGNGQKLAVLNMPEYDQERFHFGFVLGVNQSFVTVKPIADLTTHIFDSTYLPDILPLPEYAKVLSVQTTPTPGFVIGIVANMRMGDHFDLRFIPSLAFGDRTLIYDIVTYRKGDTLRLTMNKKVPSTYISFPLEVRFKAKRYNNFRPYVLAGVQYSLDLASQAKKREQRNRNEKIVKFNQNDIYINAGVGFDFYNEWFKLGIELKMMYGINDVLKREDNVYTESIAKVNSKIFQLSFTFE